MNPVLPREHFVPDVEAREMPDGRLYLYGSYDISGQKSYCSQVLHVFSTKDMEEWVDHGVCFSSRDVPWAREGQELYAPDCIYRDGKYYLYFCMNGNVEGVAESDCPWGPFRNARPVFGADKDGIDPAVFLDDDGQAYYYWGQFRLRGARLNMDMHTLDLSSLQKDLIDEKRHGFHEGASMRKHGGLYYLTYTDISRGRPTCIGYSVSKSPLGPFDYKGIIIDNVGCDPKTWNNHGSIAPYAGQWYVFYHRSSQNSEFSRRVCTEPIAFEEDGRIKEVLPTTQGCGRALRTDRAIQAADACRLGGWGSQAHIAPDFYQKMQERHSMEERHPGELLADVSGCGWAVYRDVEFGCRMRQASLLLETSGNGTIGLWAGNECLGEIRVSDTCGERKEFVGNVKPFEGTCPLYLEWQMEEGVKAAIKSLSFRNEVEHS